VNRTEAIQLVQGYARVERAFDQLEKSLEGLTHEVLSNKLLFCGVIPEMYAHDSSEEKLWAKYCDIILAQTLSRLGLQASVLRTRGDSADVFGQAEDYTIVGDAKAFRLSRTAKNQKDFKVKALDDWRRGSTFACLASPLAQYPSGSSQIYHQAEEHNVTLLSYIHLRFLLDHRPKASLKELWEVPGTLEPSKDARRYWEAIDDAIVALTGVSYKELKEYKTLEVELTKKLGEEGIEYWQSVIEKYKSLSKEEAIKRLIRAEKIDEKIKTIRKAISKEVVI
jgi:hypothetical protein